MRWLIPYLWKVYWAGFNVGDLFFGITKTPQGYYSEAYIRTYGLAKLVSGYYSNTEALTNITEQGASTARFASIFAIRKKQKELWVEYPEPNTTSKYAINPSENPHKRPSIPQFLLKDAIDPITAFYAVRSKLMKGEKQFTIPMFDGRRYSEIEVKYRKHTSKGNLVITLKQNPIAGFTNNELERMDERDPEIYVYVDGDTYMPIRAKGNSLIGTAYGRLAAECPTVQACLKLAGVK